MHTLMKNSYAVIMLISKSYLKKCFRKAQDKCLPPIFQWREAENKDLKQFLKQRVGNFPKMPSETSLLSINTFLLFISDGVIYLFPT